MTDRIKVGNVYLELPKGAVQASVPTTAEKSDVPDALETPVFLTPRRDPLQDYLAKAVTPSVQAAAESAPEKQPGQMDEWLAFCGEPRVPRQWQRYQEKVAGNCGFNWFAFLLGVQWFFFHRMYLNGLVSLVCEVAPVAGFAALASSAASHGHSMGSLASGAEIAIVLGVRVGIGYWANFARYRRAEREIEKVRALNLKPGMHLDMVRAAGAVSLGAVIVLNATAVALRALMLAIS